MPTLVDQNGRPLPDTSAPPAPTPGQMVHWTTSDRDTTDVSRALTPSSLDSILKSANAGTIKDQAKLGVELEEKNWDIAQALNTRRNAVAGLTWDILPPEDDETAAAKRIAADFEAVLRSPRWDTDEYDTFAEAIFFELQSALLPGFAVAEIIWGEGGADIYGFQGIPQRHFTFLDSRRPLLVTDEEQDGVELTPGKFLVHRHRARSGDPARGGLIRPLCWLHCFANTNVKDLLTFIERYGMPFLIGRVSQDSWERDRNRLKYLIQNFGPNGGAVFSESVQTELLQAANSTGDVYFKLLEYIQAAIIKIVLGQTATSSDGGGWSNDGAQAAVRQDILEADARALENTIRAQLARPWTVYNHGPDAPVPRLHFHCEPPADRKQEAEIIQILAQSYTLDPEEIKEKTGYTVTPRVPETGGPESTAAASSGDASGAQPEGRATEDANALADDSPTDAVADTADLALSEFLAANGLATWLGPLQAAIEAVVDEPDERRFRERLEALTGDLPALYDAMNTAVLEDTLQRLIITEAAAGRAAKAEELAIKEQGRGSA